MNSTTIGYSSNVAIQLLMRALALGFFREQPGQRFVVRAQYERARKQIDTEMSDSGDDGETLSLKRRVVLLGRPQLLRKKEIGRSIPSSER